MFIPSLTGWNIQNILLRMLVSFFLGALIGIDRGVKRRGGGARTDAAVCLGAAMVMITAQYMNLFCDGGTDISRMAAQVVSGVGFLGAGSIIVSHHQVKGLTSAAGIWICACIGLEFRRVLFRSLRLHRTGCRDRLCRRGHPGYSDPPWRAPSPSLSGIADLPTFPVH